MCKTNGKLVVVGQKADMKYIVKITGGFCGCNDLLFISLNGDVTMCLANYPYELNDWSPDKYSQEYMDENHCSGLGVLQYIPDITGNEHIVNGTPRRGMDTMFYDVYLPNGDNILKMDDDSFWRRPKDDTKCHELGIMAHAVSQMLNEVRMSGEWRQICVKRRLVIGSEKVKEK